MLHFKEIREMQNYGDSKKNQQLPGVGAEGMNMWNTDDF